MIINITNGKATCRINNRLITHHVIDYKGYDISKDVVGEFDANIRFQVKIDGIWKNLLSEGQMTEHFHTGNPTRKIFVTTQLQKPKEYILCAALHYDDGVEHVHQPENVKTGIIVCGLRHNNCYSIISGLTGNNQGKLKVKGREAQGFLTSANRYVDRYEGYEIAKKNNQVWHNFHGNNGEPNRLASEDLY